MSSVELRSKCEAKESDGSDAPRNVAGDRDNSKSRIWRAPIVITLGTVALAALLVWAMWEAYMAAPWTRDGTVRVYIVTMAPEVAGRIVELPVADNQFVHKGDERSKSIQPTIVSR
jgi:multidrug resistance efflux pump